MDMISCRLSILSGIVHSPPSPVPDFPFDIHATTLPPFLFLSLGRNENQLLLVPYSGVRV